MANLFWKSAQGTRQLVSTPFKTEEALEKTVFEAAGLLQDIFPLKRQVRGGGKATIPDIIGIDLDGNVCVIELKNVTVDANIIPQVLQYAIWAETSPDSIKSLWLEAKNRPDDITINWDNLNVRIIVVAPTILRSTLLVANKINYEVDLIEVNRWVDGKEELLLVNQLEREPTSAKAKPVSGLETYDETHFKTNFNPQSATLFLHTAHALEQFVKKNEWNLELKFNKNYCSFKTGFFNAFGLKWISSKTFVLFVKVTESEAQKTGVNITKYDSLWKEAIVQFDPAKLQLDELKPLLEAAYTKKVG
jgi:hypothetical protein